MPALNQDFWADQYQLAHLDQLRKHFNDRAIQRFVSQRVIERAQPSVYRIVSSTDTERQRLKAICLSGDPLIASHRSAAWLYGLLPEPPSSHDVCTLPAKRFRRHGAVVHRSQDLAADAVTAIDHIPVTSPELTLLHLGTSVRGSDVRRAINRAISLKLVTLDLLLEFTKAHGRSGKTGCGTFRDELSNWHMGGALESELEHRFLELIRRAGLPEPVFQYEVILAEDWVVRVDAAWPDLALAVELDGFIAHGDPVSSEQDQLRQIELERLGWRVERFGWGLVTRHPAVVIGRLRSVMGQLPQRP